MADVRPATRELRRVGGGSRGGSAPHGDGRANNAARSHGSAFRGAASEPGRRARASAAANVCAAGRGVGPARRARRRAGRRRRDAPRDHLLLRARHEPRLDRADRPRLARRRGITARLHRRARRAPAVRPTARGLAACGTGIAGGYATLAAATILYGLLPPVGALVAASAIAAAGVLVALAWSSQALAALAFLGAALAPAALALDEGGAPPARHLQRSCSRRSPSSASGDPGGGCSWRARP